MSEPDTGLAEFVADIVAEACTDENTRRQEHRDPTDLTMSGLGGCTRRNAYAVAGTPPTDTPEREEARHALLGAGAHDWLLPAMARVITRRLGVPVDVEKPVKLSAAGIVIHGSLDLAWQTVVADLKSVGEHRLHGVRRREMQGLGAYTEHQIQIGGYGLAEIQAGRPVTRLVFLYMDRSTGQVHPMVSRFGADDPQLALAVIDRVETIVRFAEEGPDTAPRDERGPGVSLACNRCPWLRACWGDTARPGEVGPQTQLAATPDGLLEILALAFAASGVTSAANADRDFAKLVLSCTNEGQYGEYKLSRSPDGDEVDSAAMQAILTDLGIEIPRKPRSGSMRVKLANPPKGKK